MNIKNLFVASTAACAIAFTSCGKDPKGVDKTTLKANEAVEQWSKDVDEGQIASLWDSLPPSYQDDVEEIVHMVGEDIDAEIYDEVMKTLTAANNLLKNKKSIVLELVEEMGAGNEEMVSSVKENYDDINAFLTTLMESDIKTADGLKSIDIAEFAAELQDDLKPLVKAALASQKEIDIDAIKTEIISEEGDKATAKVFNGDTTKEVKLVRVEERWIPAEMAENWEDMVSKAKAELENNVSKMKPADKIKVKTLLTGIQNTIAEMEKANSKEEMMEIAGGMMSSF